MQAKRPPQLAYPSGEYPQSIFETRYVLAGFRFYLVISQAFSLSIVRLYTASLRSADVRGKGVVSYTTSLVRGASKFEQYISDLPDWALPPEGGKELWQVISDAIGASDNE
jgi:hypothetical protein